MVLILKAKGYFWKDIIGVEHHESETFQAKGSF